MEILNNFREKIKADYRTVKKWKKFIFQLKRFESGTQILFDKNTVPFVLNNELIYYIDSVNARRRFCIFKTLK